MIAESRFPADTSTGCVRTRNEPRNGGAIVAKRFGVTFSQSINTGRRRSESRRLWVGIRIIAGRAQENTRR